MRRPSSRSPTRPAAPYYSATDAQTLSDIYAGIDTRLTVKPEETEVTSLFAGVGLLVLMVGGAASLAWIGRLP